MPAPILATKLYVPPHRPKVVLRPRLIERLNEGLQHKLTLISAAAGFGKTTLVSEWVAGYERPASWLSLDEGDNDPNRFLAYLVAALQTVAADIGAGVLAALQSPQPPPSEALLTTLLNEIAVIPDKFILVLDDYHAIDSKPIDQALAFLLDHLPPQMHLVIATREDPNLPLARLRARGQLTELRAADLRFTPAEAAEFLNQVMGLNLSADDVAALETRTEGWIAGLQLAAISMQGEPDTAGFIQSFTGSHHFVLDYLIEEVLGQQSASVQTFLLRTSILERMCGPLCDAVCSGGTVYNSSRTAILPDASASGQETLEYLEHANLFVVPLDNERRWYRYHHLFADLLRQRLQQSLAASEGQGGEDIAKLHIHASQWFEENRLAMEAFQHAAVANDVERAERLIQSKAMPIHFRPVVMAILDWLGSLPAAVKDVRPSLWVRSATYSLVAGISTGVEEKLQAAEAALDRAGLQGAGLDDRTRDLLGQIAAARATLAVTHYQPDEIFVQARRALEYLPLDDLAFRFTAYWTLALACQLQGDRIGAKKGYSEALAISRLSGDAFSIILATTGLGEVQELDNQLYQAAETYRSILPLFGEHPLPNACDAYLGLARLAYEWNDLDAAERYGQQSLEMARLYDRVIDRFIVSELFLARLKLAQGDLNRAAAIVAQAEQSALQNNFVFRLPEVAAAQALVLLQQDRLVEAAQLAQAHSLTAVQARVHLAQGDSSAALAILEPLLQEMAAKGWQDERLKVVVLQAVALHAHGEKDRAVQLLGEALALAEPGGFIRIFVDEGTPMARLLSEADARRILPDYAGKLLAVFEAEKQKSEDKSYLPPAQPLIEPLSQRELIILQLIAQGLSNREISERLFLALSTVKGHNQKIFDKLQVQSRTEAVARARELGLL